MFTNTAIPPGKSVKEGELPSAAKEVTCLVAQPCPKGQSNQVTGRLPHLRDVTLTGDFFRRMNVCLHGACVTLLLGSVATATSSVIVIQSIFCEMSPLFGRADVTESDMKDVEN
ncbi:hypothetical protein AVEN_216845-1 [Araneus ventricosus]|uniref:Uncharacterized protein n=1 Tax=Araneus ventricosus TaxID=182803 RepID=A0A4Y2UKZ2_ARAVE|nr:hypothetical protein AVEN_216845-1 [Araneus ventricosus]